jgi:hypothetical protein
MERTSDHDAEDALVGRAVRSAGPASGDASLDLPRWRASFEVELGAVLHRRRRRRIWVAIGGVAAAAGLLVVARVFVDAATHAPIAPPAVVLARADGTVYRAAGQEVRVGEAIRVGERLRTTTRSRAVLAYRNAEVRVDRASTVAVNAARLVLESGAVYVDTGAERSTAEPPVTIETPFGTVTHRGTQFLVEVSEAGLLAAVREGTLLLSSDAVRRELAGGGGRAQTIRIDRQRRLTLDETSSYGGIWSWVSRSAPPYAAEGRTVDEYLRWLAREHGLRLVYADPGAREHAVETTLHGDLDALSVPDRLIAIGATTGLAVVHGGDVVTVASEGDQQSGARDDR